MFIIKHKNIFIGISIFLVLLSILSFFTLGIKVGIDFKGGALLEVSYKGDRPEQEVVVNSLESLDLGAILVQPTGDKNFILKSRDLKDSEHDAILEVLSLGNKDNITEVSFNSIGPSVGRELTRKAIVSVVLVSLGIILFIAFAFRKVSLPVSSWKYGLIAIGTLLHDVIIPVGLFTIFSRFYGAEMDTLFVVAVLTILGLSVADTIVIFDRIRENLKNFGGTNKINFPEIVGNSIDQSYVRSIATSMTVILVLLALVFVGPETTKYFALMLTAGMFFGTYSSIFLASPLLVLVQDLQNKK